MINKVELETSGEIENWAMRLPSETSFPPLIPAVLLLFAPSHFPQANYYYYYYYRRFFIFPPPHYQPIYNSTLKVSISAVN